MKKAILSFFVLLLVVTSVSAQEKRTPKAKYIFLFIGDGMGFTEVNATEAYLAAKEGKIGIKKLDFTQFPNIALATTYAADRYITDSAAAGTALSTGQKTAVETVGMDVSKKKKLKNMAEMARDAGMKVGIISTVNMNDATPSTFYAHQPHRKMYKEITQDLLNSEYDLFAGGGLKKVDVKDALLSKGYKITSTKREFSKINKGCGKLYAMCPNLDKDMACRFSIDQDSSDIKLKDFVSRAIDVLDNPNGFFIMTESGKIDWANHANDAPSAIKDILALNDAVKEAIKFYKKHPDQTLIVVTSDHETGGFAQGSYKTGYDTNFKLLDDRTKPEKTGVSWCTDSHTGTPVGVFAIGNGTDKLRGYIDNTDVAKAIISILVAK